MTDAANKIKSIRIATVIIDFLIQQNNGHAVIFGVAGDHWLLFNQILMKAINQGLATYIHATSEYASCFAAASYGVIQSSKHESETLVDKTITGVATTTSGPGVMMAMTALASTLREEKPLVSLCTVPLELDVYAFQFIDMPVVTAVTKAWFFITLNQSLREIKAILDKAFYISKNGTIENPGPGSVVIYIQINDIPQKNLSHLCIDFSFDSYVEPMPAIVDSQHINKIVSAIISVWNQSDVRRVIFRVGDRIRGSSVRLIKKLVRQHPNSFLTLTYGARGLISPEFHRSLDLDGPLGNNVANQALINANLVVEFGLGVIYSLYVREELTGVNRQVIRIYDDGPHGALRGPHGALRGHKIQQIPDTSLKFQASVNAVVEQLYERRTELQKKTPWYIVENPTQAFYLMLQEYLNTDQLTVGKAIALSVSLFYDCYYFANCYDYNFVMDVGTAAYMGGQLLRMRKGLGHNLRMLSQFSPIGASFSVATGAIYSNCKDTVLFIGDGALFMMTSSLVDLNNAAKRQNARVLVLIFNDKRYANVALAEKELYGKETFVTQTQPLQTHTDITAMLQMVRPIELILCLDLNFIKSFRDREKNYTQPGLYISLIECITSDFVRSTVPMG